MINIILIFLTLEILNSVKVKKLYFGMEVQIPMWILDFSTFSERLKNGLHADGILLMKAFLNSGESPMFLKYKFAIQLRHKSMVKELS